MWCPQVFCKHPDKVFVGTMNSDFKGDTMKTPIKGQHLYWSDGLNSRIYQVVSVFKTKMIVRMVDHNGFACGHLVNSDGSDAVDTIEKNRWSTLALTPKAALRNALKNEIACAKAAMKSSDDKTEIRRIIRAAQRKLDRIA